MTETNATPHRATEQAINQRLDAIDRALLDLLPRNERLSIVAQVDGRVRELVATSATSDMGIARSATYLTAADAALTAPIVLPAARMRRSRLAITSGLLGIVALILLFVTPVTYVIVGFLGEILGEVVAIALLGIHVGMVTLVGLTAMALAIAALIILKRRQGALVGYGWAIAGLCTGPLPMFAGAATGLFLGMQFMDFPMIAMQSIVGETCPSEACDSSPARYAAPATYSPAPSGVPTPLSGDPTEPCALVPPDYPVHTEPPVQPPLQSTASESPALEPETRPEPPGVPEGGGAGGG